VVSKFDAYLFHVILQCATVIAALQNFVGVIKISQLSI